MTKTLFTPTSRSRTPWGVLVCLLATIFLVTGCGSTQPKTSSYEGTVTLPVPPPPTFVTKGTWQARITASAPVVPTKVGVLTFIENTSLPPNSYQAALLDPRTGEARWTSAAIPSAKGTPALAWTSINGRSWAVVTVREEGSVTTVYAYDGSVGGKNVEAVSSKRFSGTDTAAPQVVVGDMGVLVSGVKDAGALIFYPESGATSVYGKGPKVGGKPGVPVLAYRDGFIVSFPAGGFAYASDNGGWVAKAPLGAKTEVARYLAAGDGVVIALWPTSSTEGIVAVHQISDGSILAQMPLTDLSVVTDATHSGSTVVMSENGAQVGYANMVFSLASRKGEVLDLRGGHVVSISRGIAYAKGAKSPLATPTSTPNTPSSTSASATSPTSPSTPSASTATPSSTQSQTSDPVQSFEFTGDVAMDVATHAPLAGKYGMVPVGFTSLGEGLFTTLSASQTLFSIAVK